MRTGRPRIEHKMAAPGEESCRNGHSLEERSKTGRCLACARDRRNRYYQKNDALERQRMRDRRKTPAGQLSTAEYRMMYRYGITIKQFKRMFISQLGKCKICREKLVKLHMHIDHCHSTGKVRGILCRGCNTGLGGFKDNVQSLQRAVRYLERS